MSITRRSFVQLSGTTALGMAAGCGRVPEAPMTGKIFSAPQEHPFAVPAGDSLDLVSHYLNRLSFGPRPGDYQHARNLGETQEEAIHNYVEEQLHPDRIPDDFCDRAIRRLQSLTLPAGELFEYKDKVLLRELVRGTTLRAVYSRRQLYEVMVQFWTDHFNIDPSKGDCKWLKVWDDREVIRKYALGKVNLDRESSFKSMLEWLPLGGGGDAPEASFKFPDMVRASALSPAMLWYLDGRENRKQEHGDKPNENYARELLELHTMGVHGGYTQQDVMEVARCLTGWDVRKGNTGAGLLHGHGKVEFKPWRHDDGSKTVLGETIPAGEGAKDLEHVLRIISLHPSTARYLATKLCRRFLADSPPPGAIQTVARAFLTSKGDIPATLRALFATQEFREARGNKFKRPFHFVVSALRAADADTDCGEPIYDYLLRMGHAPFNYPTPDGYPADANPWMGTLLWRWNFALALSENRIDNGTRVRVEQLTQRAGGDEPLMAHLLGRRASPEEVESYHASGNGLALSLASPGFQWC